MFGAFGIVGIAGLVLNLVGTVLVSISVVRVIASMHAGLAAHQEALHALAGAGGSVAAPTPLDARRDSDFRTAESRMRIGFRLIAAGFALQLAAIGPGVIVALGGA